MKSTKQAIGIAQKTAGVYPAETREFMNGMTFVRAFEHPTHSIS